jgi:hypothetical protein
LLVRLVVLVRHVRLLDLLHRSYSGSHAAHKQCGIDKVMICQVARGVTARAHSFTCKGRLLGRRNWSKLQLHSGRINLGLRRGGYQLFPARPEL